MIAVGPWRPSWLTCSVVLLLKKAEAVGGRNVVQHAVRGPVCTRLALDLELGQPHAWSTQGAERQTSGRARVNRRRWGRGRSAARCNTLRLTSRSGARPCEGRQARGVGLSSCRAAFARHTALQHGPLDGTVVGVVVLFGGARGPECGSPHDGHAAAGREDGALVLQWRRPCVASKPPVTTRNGRAPSWPARGAAPAHGGHRGAARRLRRRRGRAASRKRDFEAAGQICRNGGQLPHQVAGARSRRSFM